MRNDSAATPSDGTPVARLPRFEVTIHYCEPTYAESRGIPEKDYHGVFIVAAMTDEEAREIAIAEFEMAVAQETVGWTREIKRVECCRVGETAATA